MIQLLLTIRRKKPQMGLLEFKDQIILGISTETRDG